MVTFSDMRLRATWRQELLPFLLAFASEVEITTNLIKLMCLTLFMAISTKLNVDANKQVRCKPIGKKSPVTLCKDDVRFLHQIRRKCIKLWILALFCMQIAEM